MQTYVTANYRTKIHASEIDKIHNEMLKLL